MEADEVPHLEAFIEPGSVFNYEILRGIAAALLRNIELVCGNDNREFVPGVISSVSDEEGSISQVLLIKIL